MAGYAAGNSPLRPGTFYGRTRVLGDLAKYLSAIGGLHQNKADEKNTTAPDFQGRGCNKCDWNILNKNNDSVTKKQ